MALLKVLNFPDKRLKVKAEPVLEINEEIKNIVKDMIETMYDYNGVGLAATQVNIHKRIFVMDMSEKRDTPIVCINPEIVATEDEMFWEEGCLSLPGVYAKVKRHKKITIEYLDIDGKKQMIAGNDDLTSACLQHELDHINGVLFYDHLSPLKQKIIAKKLKKMATKEKE